MRQFLRPRTPAPLSPSLQRQISKYAVAASAAGMATLALAQFSDAEIVYTPANKKIETGKTISLDVDGDGVVDFKIRDVNGGHGYFYFARLSVLPVEPGNGVWGHLSSYNSQFASALFPGVAIGAQAPFYSGRNRMAYMATSTGLGAGFWGGETCTGPWANVKHRYLGLKFQINGETHFGWARLSIDCPRESFLITGALTGYAYETTPNHRIKTGQTSGPDEITKLQEPPAAQPGVSLGELAKGAPASWAWRRKQTAARM